MHPLGILVDYRLLAWNYPAGAQDIVFLIASVYNITSTNPADYAQHRPAMQAILLAQAQKFQSANNARFSITLPTGGYTIGPMYIAMAGDNDIGNDANDYNGLHLPFAMGYTYEGAFDKGKAGWSFDPTIFAAPVLRRASASSAIKYLKGPMAPGAIQLLSRSATATAGCALATAIRPIPTCNYPSAGRHAGSDRRPVQHPRSSRP